MSESIRRKREEIVRDLVRMFFFCSKVACERTSESNLFASASILCGMRGERELFAVRANLGGTRRRRLFVLDILKISIRAGKWGKTRHTFCCAKGRESE